MKSLILVAVVAACLFTAAPVRSEDSACELRCSITYTAEVRKCEHEPACLQQAHQKYDACAAKCGKR